MTGTVDTEMPSSGKSGVFFPTSAKEPVGETLRKARESRRLSIESLAKTLKVKAKYIEALEANKYDIFPGDVYIRSYLRSLSHFFSLDAEKILARFFEERGVSGVDTLRKDSSTKINLPALKEKEKPHTVIVVVITLIVLLAVFSFILHRNDWSLSHAKRASKSSPAAVAKTPLDSTLRTAVAAPTEADRKKAAARGAHRTDTARTLVRDPKATTEPVPTKQSKDSLPKAVTSVTKPAAGFQEDTGWNTPATLIDVAKRSRNEGRTMRLRITALSDSTWARIFSDGQQWRNTIQMGRGVTFTARDSFNVHIGRNEAVSFMLDGKPLMITGAGVMAFKIDQSGLVQWTTKQWNEVFQNRFYR